MSIATELSESSYKWTTRNELRYLEHIGEYQGRVRETYCAGAPSPMPPAATMLRNYLKGAEYRVDWGSIDRERVLTFAAERLAEITLSLPERRAALVRACG